MKSNITNDVKYHKWSQISEMKSNITIVVKYQKWSQISEKKSRSQMKWSQLSQMRSKITNEVKNHKWSQISQMKSNITNEVKYHKWSQISQMKSISILEHTSIFKDSQCFSIYFENEKWVNSSKNTSHRICIWLSFEILQNVKHRNLFRLTVTVVFEGDY